MEQRETECCTPNGQIKRYKDCIGCDKKPLELNQNKMAAVERIKTFFVIRELSSEKYLSVDNMFDDWNMCKEFDNEESALKELEKLDGFFVIEKVYNP